MYSSIKTSNNCLYLRGDLNSETFKNVKSQVNSYLKKHKRVVLDINEVTEIDSHAVESLAKLFKKASKANKKISIQGLGTKDIYDELIYRSII